MKSRIVILLAVAAAFLAVIALKPRARQAPAPANPPAKTVVTTKALAPSPAPSILMVVDPHEEDEAEGCGAIIRIVRAAPGKGYIVTELGPDSDSPLMKQHKIVAQPTVILFDANGNEALRFEGEDERTIEALRSAIEGAKGSA